MEPVQKSGYFYPNHFGRILVEALEEVLGKKSLNGVLNLARLPHLIDHYPPDNLERQFEFAAVSAINQALEEMYGPRRGRELALRAGRATFADALRSFGAQAGIDDLAFKILPLPAKLSVALPELAKIFSQLSDQQGTVLEKEHEFIYTVQRCPACWGRKGVDKPVCFTIVGLLQEGLKWFSGGSEFRVMESKCAAMGHEVCEFVVQKKPPG